MFIKILLNIVLFISTILTIRYIIKSNSKKHIKVFKVIITLLILWIIFFATDYTLAQNQKLPIFSTKLFGLLSYQDGGTVEYIGIGYKVIDFHKLVHGLNGWENEYKYEKIYICPWHISCDEAFRILEKEYLENKR